MIDIKWKCRKCGQVNRWFWAMDKASGLVWHCDDCGAREVFEMVETRPGKWRRRKETKAGGLPAKLISRVTLAIDYNQHQHFGGGLVKSLLEDIRDWHQSQRGVKE